MQYVEKELIFLNKIKSNFAMDLFQLNTISLNNKNSLLKNTLIYKFILIIDSFFRIKITDKMF